MAKPKIAAKRPIRPTEEEQMDNLLHLLGKLTRDQAHTNAQLELLSHAMARTEGRLEAMARPPKVVRVLRKRLRHLQSLTSMAYSLRPVRVVRKHLRTLGLLKSPLTHGSTTHVALLESLRTEAPSHLKPFFEPLSRYEAWRRVNVFTDAARDDLLSALAALPTPRISLVTPVHNTPARHLNEMIASVLAQAHPDWELCLADDASTSRETLAALEAAVRSDPRIKLVRLKRNGGISAATNAAAKLATGEVLAFLDHDDILTPDCVGELALCYGQNPEADIVYSDDDKINEDGTHHSPQFKPEWSPVLLLSYMYLSHMFSVRRKLFETLGGFRSGFDGSQDYDFALRAAENARAVRHIPKILYHWRVAAGSTAQSGDAKPDSFERGRLAVQEALDRRGISARSTHPQWAMDACVGMFSLKFPNTGPRVSIIIPTYNKAGLLSDCIQSIAVTTYDNYEIIIVDNGSDELNAIEFLAEIEKTPNISVLRIPRSEGGFNFAHIMNTAVEDAGGDFVLLLNNDTKVISPDWLSQMVGYGLMEGVGSVGARLYFEDGTLQHGGIVHGWHEGLVGHAFRGAPPHDWGYMGFIRTAREYSAVTAACLLTRRSTYREMGGLDADKFAVAYNDVDYGFRLVLSGLSNIYCPAAELYHLEGKSRGKRDNPRELTALRDTYRTWIDHGYNPNLSLSDEHFRTEPRRAPRRRPGPVRVAAVSHNLNLEGAPNTLFDLMVGLKSCGGADPVVLSPHHGPLRELYEDSGIKVIQFTPPGKAAPESYDVGLNTLADIFAELDVDVVVVNTLPMYYAVNAAERAGIPSIWCQHESEPWTTYFDDQGAYGRLHAYAAFAQAYRVTYVATATLQDWRGVQTRHNAQIIRHAVPPERMEAEVCRWSASAARRRLGIRKSETCVILMGTICRRKGQLDLAQALGRLGQPIPKIKVFIVGHIAEPDYADSIRSSLATLPPALAAAVELTGAVDDMTLYYAAADIAVCCSRVESAPRVIVEAMAFGLPIVTTPVFGIPELVDENVNALFYNTGDIAALANTIQELCQKPLLRQTLAAQSRDVLHSRPGWDDMIRQYRQLLDEAALLKRTMIKGQIQ